MNMRHSPLRSVCEIAREWAREGSAEVVRTREEIEELRRRDGVDKNELPPAEALRLVREIRAMALAKDFEDSAPYIRMLRDTR